MESIKKILIIRFSSIGDIVLTSPVVRSLKNQLQTVELHYLTKKPFYDLLKDNPNLSKVHLWEKSNETNLLSALKNEQFDYIVDLHNNLRTKKFILKLKVKSSSFPKLNLQKWLYVNLKKEVMPDLHIVDRYYKAVEKIGVQNDNQGLDFFINPTNEVDLSESYNLGNQAYLAVAVGAQFKTKRMPTSLMIKVLTAIDFPIILLGSKADEEYAQVICEALPNQKIINACGKHNLQSSASIVKQAKALLTHDTGLMHIASAFETKIISVWGNTTPQLGMYPYKKAQNDLSIHEVNNLKCRPCSKIGFAECPKGHFKCMEQQDDKEIKESILLKMLG